jgi:hypothetical protein
MGHAAALLIPDPMNIDSLIRTFLSRPTYQRLFMAFTVGLFLSCAARVSEAQPVGGAVAFVGARSAAPVVSAAPTP